MIIALLLFAQVRHWELCVYQDTLIMADGRQATRSLQVERLPDGSCPFIDSCEWMDTDFDGAIGAGDLFGVQQCLGTEVER